MDRRTGQTPQVSKAGLESTACTQPSTWRPLHYRGHESLADKETENGPLADLTHLRSEGPWRRGQKTIRPAEKLCRRTSLIRGGAAREGGWTSPADVLHSVRGEGRGAGDRLLEDEDTSSRGFRRRAGHVGSGDLAIRITWVLNSVNYVPGTYLFLGYDYKLSIFFGVTSYPGRLLWIC